MNIATFAVKARDNHLRYNLAVAISVHSESQAFDQSIGQ
jgi:hypothetical protein